jgi:bifunctional non-homologous end joining protein LigD
MLYTFSLPTKADKVPAGPDWLHEVKYDGYRMMLIREQHRVRLISRGGHDWAQRFPLIVTAALKLHQEHFVIDGETVVLGLDGVSDFGALHSGRHNERAQLYAFDMLAGDGEDQRQLPLSLRKTNLARLLKHRIPGVFIAEYEEGEIGRDLFRVACNMGLEGIVSKRRDRAYTVGENGEINSVLGKALGVLGHAEFFEPICNLLHRGPPTVSSWHGGVFDHRNRESIPIYPRYHASDGDFRRRFPSISGRNWDFRFSRSLRSDGTAQRKINVAN